MTAAANTVYYFGCAIIVVVKINVNLHHIKYSVLCVNYFYVWHTYIQIAVTILHEVKLNTLLIKYIPLLTINSPHKFISNYQIIALKNKETFKLIFNIIC